VKLGSLFRARRPADDLAVLRGRFARFRHLLEMNNRVLKLIGDANEKLGGEYLFDARYLQSLEEELGAAVGAAVHDLAEMSGNRYPALAAAYDRIQAALTLSREPRRAPQERPLTLPLAAIGTELADLVGEKLARLGEIRAHVGAAVPDGFAVTARASELLLAQPAVARALAALPEGGDAAGAALQAAIAAAEIPPGVAKAVRQALGAFDAAARFAVRSSALGEDGALSFAGQHTTVLNVPREGVLDAWRTVVASLFSPAARSYRREHGLAPAAGDMAVGCLLMVPATASGVLYSLDPARPRGGELVIAAARGLGVAVVEGRAAVDRFTVSRVPPHAVLTRAVAEKRQRWVAAPGGGVAPQDLPPAERAAPAVDDATLAALADVALRIERHLRSAQDVEWALDAAGRVIVLQARPLRPGPAAQPRTDEVIAACRRHRVLLHGRGEVACRGVGVGRVFVVGADERGAGFTRGDVLVARDASPRLAELCAAAAAVVSDVGSATGHLATVAREYRVPTIVGAEEATRALAPGAVVTVDADENTIYEGVVEELLRYQLLRGRVFEETPEFRVLRRMLRHVAPLNLRDPTSPAFAAERCRTHHDIIRFAHERALVELGRLEGIRLDGRRTRARTLDLAVPLDLVVIDIGDGVAPGAPRRDLTRAQITSRPLSVLLEGLLTPGVWATGPADMDMQGFMASATRAGPLTVPGAGAVRRNVAVVSRDYLNLNLRVGYHFNVIDCYLGDAAEDSYIFFRFVGGVTDVTRRTRRARLLAAILGHEGFKTELDGELVIGRLQRVPRPRCEERLRVVGRLVGFSRQLDILLRDDVTVDRLVDRFLRGCYHADLEDVAEEHDMAESVEVLVLDDEATVGERLKEFLETKQMKVEAFTDSATAVARLAQKRFAVVVTDLKMKGPTGLDVLATVRDRGLPTQVIIITGFRTIEAAREAECVGAFGFLDKPFHLDDLYQMVKKAAKKAGRTPWPKAAT
jgi:pyruvate,water dikinase